MSALDELGNKTMKQKPDMTELEWFIWNERNEPLAEQAAEELAALRDELDTRFNAAENALNEITRILKTGEWEYPNQVVRDVSALQQRVEELENRNKWWLENYDITMPCGHKNRYLLVRPDGKLQLDSDGSGICLACYFEVDQ